ncbi:fimbrial protein [Erwinia mallotivora]|nr:fimbrial protein [Erwinia mallotivora]
MMKITCGPGAVTTLILLMASASCPSFAASCQLSNSALKSTVLPLQSSALTVGQDVSNGTIIYHQHFRPATSVTLSCENGIPANPTIRGALTTARRLSDWSDGRFAPGTVYQTDVPGIGMAIYAYGNTQYTVPFSYPLAGIQTNDLSERGWIPHEGIEFDVVLIKTGVIIPGRIGGESLPGVNYSLYSADHSPINLGNLRFSGAIEIVSRTCTTPDIIVPMGNYEISGTFKQPGSYSPWQDASIKLTDCPRFHGMMSMSSGSGNLQQGNKINNSIKLSLSPNTPIIDSYKGILAVKSGNGSASGVGIQLAWGTQGDPSPQWVNFAESRQFFLPDDGATQFSLPLMARYIQTSSQVMPGKADATVTFTIYYY